MVHLEEEEDSYLDVKGSGGRGHLKLGENVNVNMEEIDLDSLDVGREGLQGIEGDIGLAILYLETDECIRTVEIGGIHFIETNG